MLTKRRPWAAAVLLPAALLTVALFGAFAVAHRAPWREKPVHLWSESDLPPLPKERENGWLLFHSTAGTLGEDEPPRDLRDALDHLEWARAKALASRIGWFTGDPAVRIQDAEARTALASPRFADACAIDIEVRCLYLNVRRLHDLVALGVLAEALAGRWDDALARAGSLLRADLDLMRTSRPAISALTAGDMVRRDLRLLGVLLDGIEGEAPDGLARQRARIASVASLLDPAPEPDTAAARAVVAEYVYVIQSLGTVSGNVASRARRDWWILLFLDEKGTVALANAYFEGLMRFSKSPSTREPPALPRFSRQRFGWWIYNAAGKMQLDALLVDLAPTLRAMEEQNGAIATTRDALRQRARVLLE